MESPELPVRRGHAITVTRDYTSKAMEDSGVKADARFVLFGGHMHDEPYNDLWIFDINRPRENRVWTRLD